MFKRPTTSLAVLTVFFVCLSSSVTSAQWYHQSWRKVILMLTKHKFLIFKVFLLHVLIFYFCFSQTPHSQMIWRVMEICRGAWASRQWRERESRSITPCRRSKSLMPDHGSPDRAARLCLCVCVCVLSAVNVGLLVAKLTLCEVLVYLEGW